MFSHSRQRVEELCRERASPVYLGNRRSLSRILARYKFFTSTADAGFAPHILLDGYWEMWLTEFMVRTVQEGWTALDVGANYGYYSVLLADLVGAAGNLIAVEPNPAAAADLAQSIAINGLGGRSQVVEAAASDHAGEIIFLVPYDHPSEAMIIPQWREDSTGDVLTVPSATLDTLCAECDRVDFIKIDAEGAEGDIFNGMQGVIERHNPLVIMEFDGRRDGSAELAGRLSESYPRIQCLREDGQLHHCTMENAMSAPDLVLLALKR